MQVVMNIMCFLRNAKKIGADLSVLSREKCKMHTLIPKNDVPNEPKARLLK